MEMYENHRYLIEYDRLMKRWFVFDKQDHGKIVDVISWDKDTKIWRHTTYSPTVVLHRGS